MINFVGDICLANGNNDFVDINFDNLLVKELKNNFVVANLECVSEKSRNIDYSSFNFCFPEERINILHHLGVNCVSLANNHIMDGGSSGLISTINNLEKHGISYFGAGSCLEDAEKPFFLNKDGKLIAIIGRLETESFVNASNCIASSSSPGVAPLNIPSLILLSEQLKAQGVDKVFLCVHWGTQELRRSPKRIHDRANYILTNTNVDIIIGHHSHCIQSSKSIGNKHVFFGLGNFFFLPYFINGISLYDGSITLNSESLFVSTTFKGDLIHPDTNVVRQHINGSINFVSNFRKSFVLRRVFGCWSNMNPIIYNLEYRLRGLKIEVNKFKLIFISDYHRNKIIDEIRNPKLIISRIYDLFFNPRHR